jgi:hypothetical protein
MKTEFTDEEAEKHGKRLANLMGMTPNDEGRYWLEEGYRFKTPAGLFRSIVEVMGEMMEIPDEEFVLLDEVKKIITELRSFFKKRDKNTIGMEIALDDLVTETAERQASNTVNNEGPVAQVCYLIRNGWKPDEIITRAKEK